MESYYLFLKIIVIACAIVGIVQIVLGVKKGSLPTVVFGVVMLFPTIVSTVIAFTRTT